MSLTAYTAGLSNDQLDYISTALSQHYGEGTVDLQDYELSSTELVKKVRLTLSDPSVVGIFLPDFSQTLLEKSRALLESSPKFFQVDSTNDLLGYLNTTFGTSFSLPTSQPTLSAQETPNTQGVSTELLEEVAHLRSLLASKDSTIQELQTILKELQEEQSYYPTPTTGYEEEVASLKASLSDYKERYALESGLVRSQQNRIKELEASQHKATETIADLESHLQEQKVELNQLRLESQQHSKDSNRLISLEGERDRLLSQVSQLNTDLETERATVVELNRKLMHSNPVTGIQSEEYIEPDQPVWGSLWSSGSPKLHNLRFIFAGSGDSSRLAYLRAEDLLKSSPNGGIFLDLSTESLADYRFGVRKPRKGLTWLQKDPNSLEKYLSKTKYPSVRVLAGFGSSYNERSLRSNNLYSYLTYLNQLGVPVVVYGGSITSTSTRDLMSSALYISPVEVIGSTLGTSTRAMYFNSLMVGGSLKATYFVSGKIDEMSQKVVKLAKRAGYVWEVLNNA